jgi:hypothetical protein
MREKKIYPSKFFSVGCFNNRFCLENILEKG